MHRLLTGKLRIEYLTIPIANLPANLSGTKIVQLTDFHYDGVRLSEWLLEEAIAAANEAEPDLIFLTGDFITYDPRTYLHLSAAIEKFAKSDGNLRGFGQSRPLLAEGKNRGY